MGMFDECENLEEAVYVAVDAASLCWDDLENAGTFDDHQANQIAEELLTKIRSWVNDVSFTVAEYMPPLPEPVKNAE